MLQRQGCIQTKTDMPNPAQRLFTQLSCLTQLEALLRDSLLSLNCLESCYNNLLLWKCHWVVAASRLSISLTDKHHVRIHKRGTWRPSLSFLSLPRSLSLQLRHLTPKDTVARPAIISLQATVAPEATGDPLDTAEAGTEVLASSLLFCAKLQRLAKLCSEAELPCQSQLRAEGKLALAQLCLQASYHKPIYASKPSYQKLSYVSQSNYGKPSYASSRDITPIQTPILNQVTEETTYLVSACAN